MSFTDYHSSTFWIVWAVLLVAQNVSFTLVSRARNSGSVGRHMAAALISNGIWFLSQVFAIGTITAILIGKLGTVAAVGAGTFYTAFTLLGSLVGHKISLRTETGAAMVGANNKYAQITVEDYERIQKVLSILPSHDSALHALREAAYLQLARNIMNSGIPETANAE